MANREVKQLLQFLSGLANELEGEVPGLVLQAETVLQAGLPAMDLLQAPLNKMGTLSAKYLAHYRDTLMEEGFTREEAMIILLRRRERMEKLLDEMGSNLANKKAEE